MRAVFPIAVAVASMLAPGCCCEGPGDPRFLHPDDAFVVDSGIARFLVDVGSDARRDASDASLCALAPCTPSTCATCTPGSSVGISAGFGISAGSADDPRHPGYAVSSGTALDAPLHIFTPSLCVSECDLSAADTCGPCAACSGRLSQMPLVASVGGARVVFGTASRRFGDATGVCRPRCTFDEASTGSCPLGSTCDRLEHVCIEACTTDVECNVELGIAYDGTPVTVVRTDHARTCHLDTGRCEPAGRPGARVGDACTDDDECAPSVGVCRAGACAELGCAAQGATCGGDLGVCVSEGETTVCLRACTTASDCGAGGTCAIVEGRGVCDACSPSVPCEVGSTCAHETRHGLPGFPVSAPRCLPSCGPGDCDAASACLDLGEGPICVPLDGFCNTSADCGGGEICDTLLAGPRATSAADGHCVAPCTGDADCASLPGFECLTSGPLTGLCRAPCTSTSACFSGERCDPASGYCLEAP